MKNINLFILILILFYSSSSYSIANIFRERKAFTSWCSGETGYKTAKAACKSGKFNGKKIYECVYKKRDKSWDRVKERTCNSDGERVGVYVNNCAGQTLDDTNLKRGCALGTYKNTKLVKCRNGKEVDVFFCGEEGSVNDGDREVAIFENSCLGKKTEYRSNLKNACLLNKGKTLVACKNVCALRTGLKCQKRVWKEIKSAYCNDEGSEYTKNTRVKFEGCTPDQRNKLIQMIDNAKVSVPNVMAQMSQTMKNPIFPQGPRDQLSKAYKTMSNIKLKLEQLNMTISCQSAMNRCSQGPNAHTLWGGSAKIKMCENYFRSSTTDKYREGVLVHELSHNFGTLDAEDFSSVKPPFNGKNVKWHNNAETYEYWIKEKFCLPEINC